jgi:hypothetical protein
MVTFATIYILVWAILVLVLVIFTPIKGQNKMKKYYCANVPFPMDEEIYEKHKEECGEVIQAVMKVRNLVGLTITHMTRPSNQICQS